MKDTTPKSQVGLPAKPPQFGNGAGPAGPAAAPNLPAPVYVRPAASKPTVATSDPITFSVVADYLRRAWRLSVPIGLVLAIVAASLIYFTFVPQYRATAWLKLKPARGGVIGALPSDDAWLETQLQLMKSPIVLGQVLTKPEVARLETLKAQEEPLQWLQKNLRVTAMGRSELYQVVLDCGRREDAIHLVDAVVQSYYDMEEDEDSRRNQELLELIKQAKEKHQREVQRLQDSLKEQVRQATGKDLTGFSWRQELSSRENPLAAVQTELSKIEQQAAVLEAQLQVRKDELERLAEPSETEVERAAERHSETQQWRAALAAMRGQLADTRERLRNPDSDAGYQRLAADLKAQEQKFEEFLAETKTLVREELMRIGRADREREVAEIEQTLGDLRIREGLVRTQYQQLKEDTAKTGEREMDVEFARGELALEMSVFEFLRDRVVKLETELSLTERNVEILKSAQAPNTPVELLPYKLMGAAAGGAFVAPFLLGFFWERTLRKVSHSDQLEKEGAFRFVGEIASLPVGRVGSRRRSAKLEGGLSLYRESIDSLRTSLVLGQDLESLQVIVITSAVSGEGKTSVSSQLAVSLARSAGERTLLIDGDMRHPDLHEIFEINRTPGLAEVLGGSVMNVRDAIVTQNEFLDILPAGKLRQNPHSLVTGPQVAALLDELRQTYRYIVIDTPPTLAASESLVWAKRADATLVCAMRDVTRLDQFRTVCTRLANADAPAVGAVLNGIPTNQYYYRYGGYYQEKD